MYTYAFLLNPTDLLELPEGITGSLELIRVHDVAALVEPGVMLETLQSSDEQLVQAVLSHDQIIREVFLQVTLLPLRFGTCFVSHQALVEHLELHGAEYLEKLLSFQGKAEYPLKLVPRSFSLDPVADNLKGKDYFLAKKQHYQRQVEWQQQQQAELHHLLKALTQEYPHLVRGEPDQDVERIYLLSDRQTEMSLYQYLKDWQMQSSYWEFSLGEPLPPYHFV